MQKPYTPSIPEIIWLKNVRAIVVCGFLMKYLIKNIYPENLKKIGLDWLCYLAGNSQTAPTIFSNFQDFLKKYFIKNPQTTIALTFLTHIISGIGGVILLHCSIPREKKITEIKCSKMK